MTTGDGRVLLGVITPSSNTRLEPLTTQLLSGLPEVTAHFSRFRVVDVGLSAVSQFEPGPIIAAAELLRDAQVEVIVWSGTSGAWQGIDRDRALCAAITSETGIPATTATLALLDALSQSGARSLGLVSPYPDDMHAKVAATLSAASVPVTAGRNHDIGPSNWALSTIGEDVLTSLVGEVAAERPDVITTFCTNLNAAHLVPGWEATWSVPVFDSVSLAIWGALKLCGVDPRRIRGWGMLFQLV